MEKYVKNAQVSVPEETLKAGSEVLIRLNSNIPQY